jgi:low temperature requirement protein LtrA
MLPLLQSLTIVGMIGATYFVYQTFGPRQLSFSFTKREKREWDQLVRGRLGSWLTVNSIFATITSFATVYVFFIGNTLQFGWWIVFPVLTIWGGGFITNYFTRILVSRRHIAKRLASGDQSKAVSS